MRPRAVITGIGLVTPVGNGVQAYWSALVSGQSGIGPITLFDTADCSVRIGGEVKDLDFSRYIAPERSRKMPRTAKLAVVAAELALEDSGLEVTEENRDQIDIFLGVGCPDLKSIVRTVMRRHRRGMTSADPEAPALAASGAPAPSVSLQLGTCGETTTFSTGCSSGTNALGHALRKIRSGAGKIIFAGGADCGVQIDLIACYAAAHILSTRNDEPEQACRPFEAHRDGQVLSEAAGILVLEEYDHARARGARIYAEIRGYGATSDCCSVVRVSRDPKNGTRCLEHTLRDAKTDVEQVGYYCAHGSAARTTDARETEMLKMSLGEHAYRVPVSSTKSMTGLPIGAAGALQAATCALAIQREEIPPTINYDEPDPECDLDYVPNEARKAKIGAALTYALGMGGNNSALAFSAC